ncbi:MAG: hypothetical protein ACYS7M_00435 [Planctomycetota bacterium]|jgi:hypothetical protein
MIIEILNGVGGEPIRIPASQFVVRNDEGTPIVVGGEYGIDGAHSVAHAGDPEFNQLLQAFGVQRHEVIVDRIERAPVPGGAKLLAGPD